MLAVCFSRHLARSGSCEGAAEQTACHAQRSIPCRLHFKIQTHESRLATQLAARKAASAPSERAEVPAHLDQRHVLALDPGEVAPEQNWQGKQDVAVAAGPQVQQISHSHVEAQAKSLPQRAIRRLCHLHAAQR
jgi:hypothetical protein